MSLLLKQDPLVTSLALYDVRGAPGVAADISHVNTHSEVKGYEKAQCATGPLPGGGGGNSTDWSASVPPSRVPRWSSSPLVFPESPA